MWPHRPRFGLPRFSLPRFSLPISTALLATLLAACSTPYRPPVVVHDSVAFPGLAHVVAAAGERPVDVLLVHGMCTHDDDWARRQIERLAGIVETNTPRTAVPEQAPADARIHVLDSTRRLAGGTVRFHALVWSPLTTELKRQLGYDLSAPPTDCAAAGDCKPARARLNGYLKDKLIDDCLSDPVIYEGVAHATMRDAMVEAIAGIMTDNPNQAANEAANEAANGAANEASTLVVVAESLGSKMLFDALSAMLESNEPRLQALGRQAARRLGLLFMAGNQLPMLGLAEQVPPVTGQGARPLVAAQDTLQRFLALRRRQAAPGAASTERRGDIGRLSIVAFSDPNDLLSYRLLPARYAAPDVAVADVLVSNGSTWLGLVENPVTAHLDYLRNPEVGKMIVCGFPVMAGCK